MTIYQVSARSFYTHDGYDYQMATDVKNDICLYTNKKTALNEVKNLVERFRKINSTMPEYSENGKDHIAYTIFSQDRFSRIVIELIKKETL